MLLDGAQRLRADPQSLNPAKVLIVEDQPLVAMHLRQALADAGAQVVWVQSDRAAYIALEGRGRHFDVLVLDVDLGEGTSGFDIARFARQRDPEVGVIFSSGSPPDWLNRFGVTDALFVPKPCTAEAMIAAVASFRQRHGAERHGKGEGVEEPERASPV